MSATMVKCTKPILQTSHNNCYNLSNNKYNVLKQYDYTMKELNLANDQSNNSSHKQNYNYMEQQGSYENKKLVKLKICNRNGLQINGRIKTQAYFPKRLVQNSEYQSINDDYDDSICQQFDNTDELVQPNIQIKNINPKISINKKHKNLSITNKTNKINRFTEQIQKKFPKNKTKYITTKIQLRDIINPQNYNHKQTTKTKNRKQDKKIQNHQKNTKKRRMSTESSLGMFDFDRIDRIIQQRRETSADLWKNIQRSASSTKLYRNIQGKQRNTNKILQVNPLQRKLQKKIMQLKQINLITENLSDFQIQGLLRQFYQAEIPQPRWPLLIVDRVYQILKTKQYRDGCKRISREY